jgi:hypothetical protein
MFEGFELRFNYPISPYTKLISLSQNSCCFFHYMAIATAHSDVQEKARETLITQQYGLVRFHHFVSLETLFNGILQAKPGTVIKLYDLDSLAKKCLLIPIH